MTSIAALTAILLQLTGRPAKFVVLPAYFALMEGLQFAQYLVIDDCASKANQLFTFLGIVHIAFQPLVVNWVMFVRPYPIALGKLTSPFTYPALHKASIRLSLAAGVLMLVKATPALVALLGAHQLLTDALSPHLPARVLSVLLTNTCADPEMLCGAKLCTLAGKYHLAWVAPQMATGYYVPSLFAHFFAMFGPGLLLGSTYHRLMVVLVFVSGPIMSETVVWGGGQSVRQLEWASIWCLFSAAQVLFAIGFEVMASGFKHGKWTLPKKNDPAYPAEEQSNGAANGFHAAGAAPKKEL